MRIVESMDKRMISLENKIEAIQNNEALVFNPTAQEGDGAIE
jgi:hypothetical protein